MGKFGVYFKVWEGGGGNFLGFEICHWGMGLCNLASWYVYFGIPLIWGVEMVASEWGDLQPWSFEEDDALVYMPRITTIVILQITSIWSTINGLQGDVHLNYGEVKGWYVHSCRKGNFFYMMFLTSKNIVSAMNMDYK
jgi:hypothetical protein